MTRNYGQYCGLARALDVIGDRWNLLIVRELLVGPARYGQLLDGLPGLATNLLADRLRALEAAGIVERRLSGQPNAILYALTPWGAGLREPIEALIRWSSPLMGPDTRGDAFCLQWLAVALPALLAGTTARPPATIGIQVGDQIIGLWVTPEGVEARGHAGEERYDAVVRVEPPVILGLAAGALTFDQAAALAMIDGDEQAVRRAFRRTAPQPPDRP